MLSLLWCVYIYRGSEETKGWVNLETEDQNLTEIERVDLFGCKLLTKYG